MSHDELRLPPLFGLGASLEMGKAVAITAESGRADTQVELLFLARPILSLDCG